MYLADIYYYWKYNFTSSTWNISSCGNPASLGSYEECKFVNVESCFIPATKMNIICCLLIIHRSPYLTKQEARRCDIAMGSGTLWFNILIFKMKECCLQNTNSLPGPTDVMFDRAVRNIWVTFDLNKYSLWHLEPFHWIPFTAALANQWPWLSPVLPMVPQSAWPALVTTVFPAFPRRYSPNWIILLCASALLQTSLIGCNLYCLKLLT